MSTSTTLAAYGVALVVVFGAAAGVGSAVGPIGATAEQSHSTDPPHSTGTTSGKHDAGSGAGHDGQ